MTHLMEPDAEAVKQLEAGLNRLKTDGWGRGKYHNFETGCWCSLGALGAPFGEQPAAIAYLAYAIRQRPEADTKNMQDLSDQNVVLRFNDWTNRKWPEVEAAFKQAIRYAKGQGVSARG